MSNLYKWITTGLMVMIFSTISSVSGGTPSVLSPHSSAYFLYPPTNLQVGIMYLTAYLHWDKPQTGSGTPAGLLGYNIYRDGILLHFNSTPDSLIYYDFINDVGIFTDSVTAYYDLTSYGYPGQYGESSAASVTFSSICGAILPFYEPWDNGSFAFNDWSFVPSQGNWMIDVYTGNPLPTASFRGTPVLANYDYTLQSTPLLSDPFTCANIYVAFDSRVIVNNPTSQERLIIETKYDSTWHPVDSLVNDSSTGWVHHNFYMAGAAGKDIKLGFRAKGVNSADIEEWDVDNIYVYAVCFPPSSFTLTMIDNIFHFAWGPACPGNKSGLHRPEESVLLGYNIYRAVKSIHDSLPPFTRLNSSIITDTNYIDTTSSGDYIYCYYVTAVYEDSVNPGLTLCEPGTDTICALYSIGIRENSEVQISIYPNPISDVVNIVSDEKFTSIEILNFTGIKIYSSSFSGTTHKELSLKTLPSGNYLMKIATNRGMVLKKILKIE